MLQLPPTPWCFDLSSAQSGEDLVAIGGDLEPGTVLQAYAAGLFPMGIGVGGAEPLGWWSPDPRGILRAGDLHVSRSLRRAVRRFEVTVDRDFGGVLAACADPSREGAWITPEVVAAYTRLHERGWAHSVEVWSGGRLAGGLYGLTIGGLFAAESKFHRVTDASKVAVAALAERWFTGPVADQRVIDVQWRTEHLGTLGVVEVPREEYLRLLGKALRATPATTLVTSPR